MADNALSFLFDTRRPFVIAGPCALEDKGMALETGKELQRICKRLGVPFVFKSSYDKANRSSLDSYRGPGLKLGLEWLAAIKEKLGVPLLSDVHESAEVSQVARVLDILQVPAYLCRQTSLLVACAKSGRVVNIKKGQFVAPWDLKHAAQKVRASGNKRILLTERGVSFGYNNLVVDFTALPILRESGYPVVFDATHSVQLPGGLGKVSGGRRQYVEQLACAAAAVGVDGYFFEVHPRPNQAKSDGPNQVALKDFGRVLKRVLGHDKLTRGLRATK